MHVGWLNAAASTAVRYGLWKEAEDQAWAMFTDAVPGRAVHAPTPGNLLVDLPCGLTAEFRRTGDGVEILALTPYEPADGLPAVQDGARTVRHHGA